MRRSLPLLISALALTVSAFPQTKFSGAIDCDKADTSYAIPIPDRQGYSFAIGQNKCSWSKPVSIAGLDTATIVLTAFSEVMGTSIRNTSSGVTTFSNGDKAYNRGSGPIDPKTGIMSGKWTYAGGTGKLRGIKGGGAYTCKSKSPEPNAGMTCELEGEYTLPVAGK
jgi:hypothetical protein